MRRLSVFLVVFFTLYAYRITAVTAYKHSTTETVATDTSKVKDLDEVVIVSQPKDRQRLRQQPISSSMFTGHDINRLYVNSLSDLSSHVPSLCMPEYGSRLTSSMYIRGIGSRVNSPAVGIYADGIPVVCKAMFNAHNYQTDRIDVIRGPQGTLYGMNTEGGLIRIYSRNPMTYQGTEVKLRLGTHFQRYIEAAHLAKINGNTAFSIASFYNGSNGFQRNSTTGSHADNINEAGAKTRWAIRLGNKLSADIIADYQYSRQRAFAYGIYDIEERKTASPSNNRDNNYTRNMLNSGVTLKYVTDNIVVNSTTGYQFLSDCMNMDQDYIAADLMHLRQKQLMNAITEEITARSSNVGKWQWTNGIFASYQWLKTDAPVFFDKDFTSQISSGVQSSIHNAMIEALTGRYIAAGMTPTAATAAAEAFVAGNGGIDVYTEMDVPGIFRTPQSNVGIFHESDIDITKRLRLTLGLRYDYNHVSIDYNTRASMNMTANVMGASKTNVLTSLLTSGTHNSYSQLLPKIGLTYITHPDGSNVYIVISKGYRAGGYNIQMFSDILQTEINNNKDNAMNGSYEIAHNSDDYIRVNNTITYKPEQSWNYETGAHLNLFDNKIHADISAYYMQIRDRQLSVMAGTYGFGRMMVNAGKSYSCGFEASLRGSLAANRISWTANYSFTHAVFEEYKDYEDGILIDYKDKKVPFIPQHTIGASIEYRKPLAADSKKTLIAGTDITAQGRIYWDENNTYSQPLYAILGCHAGIDTGKCLLRLWCKNMTNTKYNTFAFDSSASGQKIYLAQKGLPVTAGIELTIRR
ncbi:MAG: TonB-dependent receptor [Prevotella sp.]